MPFGTSNSVLGLDIGRHSVKAVVMRPGARATKVQERHCLDCRAEGLMDDPEAVIQALQEWLDELGLRKCEATVCIPQYLGTVQISDFPPAAKGNLDEMVAYETQQVAGLSEEGFLHDHAVMSAGLGKQNPVVIGIAKSSVVDERVAELAPASLNLRDLALSGIALANAYFALHPEESRSQNPHLLLDIGLESSTLAVVGAGQVLFVASLMFGSQRYTLDLARHLGVSEDQAEDAKLDMDLDAVDEESPLHRGTRQLEAEIREAVEHWRSQESGEAAPRMFESIALSGGGAKLGGLVQHLGREYGCRARLIGLPDEAGHPDPNTVIAYGAALQAAGCASLPISLRPPAVANRAARRANFIHLVFALVLFTAAALLAGAWKYRGLRTEERALNERIEELNQCAELIPKLDKLIRLREHRERMVLPIVAKANRARRFLDVVEALSEVRGGEDWFIYLADSGSYQWTPEDEEDDKATRGERGGGPAVLRDDRLLGFPVGGGRQGTGGGIDPEFPTVMTVTEVQPWDSLVAAGFSKYVVTEPYRFVRRMVDRLNGTAENHRNTSHVHLFEGVDLLPNQEIEPGKQLFLPWLHRIEEAGPVQDKYKPFMLKLPFERQPIAIPEKQEEG